MPAVKERAMDRNMIDPMAAQMAQLLADSDLDELQEIVERWVAEAPTENMRRVYANFGARMLELKQALSQDGTSPRREDLEVALSMMMKMAAEKGVNK